LTIYTSLNNIAILSNSFCSYPNHETSLKPTEGKLSTQETSYNLQNLF